MIFYSIKSLKTYEKVIFVLLFLFFLVISIIRGNSINETTDFYVFWLAGKNYYAGNQMYLLQNGQLQFLYPPFAAMLFGVLAIFPLKIAAISFSILNVFLVLACFYYSKIIIERLLKIEINNLVLILTFIFTINYHISNLNLVQVNLVLFFFTLLFLKYYLQSNYFLAGLFLAVAISFKVTPVIFLPWLFIRGNFKTSVYTLVSLSFLVIVPLLFRGVNTGIEDLKLFFETMVKYAPEGAPEGYSSSRSLKSALSNYLINNHSINESIKQLIINYVPILLGLTYIAWLIIQNIKKIPINYFELSGTYLIILLTSAVTGDAHMVALTFPVMGLLAIGLHDQNKKYKYLVLALGIIFISPIGETLSYILLFKICVYTLNMLIIYLLNIYFSFKSPIQQESGY